MMDVFAQLARDGVDPARMGQAYGALAYPNLDSVPPLAVYGLGFIDGAKAALALFGPLATGLIDEAEAVARLCDPDCLPLPDIPPPADPVET